MNFKGKFLDKLAGKWLKKQDQFQALKKIGEKSDWKAAVRKCHDKLSIEYKFWITKADSEGRNTRLKDLTKDVAFINSLEVKQEISKEELAKLKQIKGKYGIE
jgi:hypothetical protein